jgi:hypothetical protein
MRSGHRRGDVRFIVDGDRAGRIVQRALVHREAQRRVGSRKLGEPGAGKPPQQHLRPCGITRPASRCRNDRPAYDPCARAGVGNESSRDAEADDRAGAVGHFALECDSESSRVDAARDGQNTGTPGDPRLPRESGGRHDDGQRTRRERHMPNRTRSPDRDSAR